jgi:hypothetical protein
MTRVRWRIAPLSTIEQRDVRQSRHVHALPFPRRGNVALAGPASDLQDEHVLDATSDRDYAGLQCVRLTR